MKKIILSAAVAAATLAMIVATASCKNKVDLTPYISELRSNVLFGESENYSVKCYSETREKPLVSDGKASSGCPAVIIKLTVKHETDEVSVGAKVTFSLDKEYSAIFVFHPESDVYVATSYVGSLPDRSLTVTVTEGEKSENVELTSIVGSDVASPLVALETASEAVKEFYDTEEFKSRAFEIHIRLIEDDGQFFYYVGFVTERETLATLVSRDGKKVLTKRVVKN